MKAFLDSMLNSSSSLWIVGLIVTLVVSILLGFILGWIKGWIWSLVIFIIQFLILIACAFGSDALAKTIDVDSKLGEFGLTVSDVSSYTIPIMQLLILLIFNIISFIIFLIAIIFVVKKRRSRKINLGKKRSLIGKIAGSVLTIGYLLPFGLLVSNVTSITSENKTYLEKIIQPSVKALSFGKGDSIGYDGQAVKMIVQLFVIHEEEGNQVVDDIQKIFSSLVDGTKNTPLELNEKTKPFLKTILESSQKFNSIIEKVFNKMADQTALISKENIEDFKRLPDGFLSMRAKLLDVKIDLNTVGKTNLEKLIRNSLTSKSLKEEIKNNQELSTDYNRFVSELVKALTITQEAPDFDSNEAELVSKIALNPEYQTRLSHNLQSVFEDLSNGSITESKPQYQDIKNDLSTILSSDITMDLFVRNKDEIGAENIAYSDIEQIDTLPNDFLAIRTRLLGLDMTLNQKQKENLDKLLNVFILNEGLKKEIENNAIKSQKVNNLITSLKNAFDSESEISVKNHDEQLKISNFFLVESKRNEYINAVSQITQALVDGKQKSPSTAINQAKQKALEMLKNDMIMSFIINPKTVAQYATKVDYISVQDLQDYNMVPERFFDIRVSLLDLSLNLNSKQTENFERFLKSYILTPQTKNNVENNSKLASLFNKMTHDIAHSLSSQQETNFSRDELRLTSDFILDDAYRMKFLTQASHYLEQTFDLNSQQRITVSEDFKRDLSTLLNSKYISEQLLEDKFNDLISMEHFVNEDLINKLSENPNSETLHNLFVKKNATLNLKNQGIDSIKKLIENHALTFDLENKAKTDQNTKQKITLVLLLISQAVSI
ncbi:hypothetical protein [[Mycoplasma] gypis]|uniref:CvpA family protein n=1 Tax=[Mycoplasma] gypis TaxID=92404 RepID=A0ABZ2RN56_9BACT|nr:hypothetical protein [[Mycoplasma] gypis]MBN0919119.1 hypothetical protein [[Mycoplasma] gypis]